MKINSLTVHPKSLVIKKEPLWSASTGRSTGGSMIGDIIAYKYTLDVEFGYESAVDAKAVENALTSSAFFNVEFLDPATNTNVTKVFYAGAGTYNVFSYAVGMLTYSGISVSLIQK